MSNKPPLYEFYGSKVDIFILEFTQNSSKKCFIWIAVLKDFFYIIF